MTARQSKTGLGGGFPHSDIHGSKLVRSSPWLFAAYHVLHRLRVPRHPPNALKTLDRSHYQCPPQKKFRASGVPVRRHTDIVRPMMILLRSTRARKTSITRDLPVKRLEYRSSLRMISGQVFFSRCQKSCRDPRKRGTLQNEYSIGVIGFGEA